MRIVLIVTVVILSLVSTVIPAESRCDCREIVSSCTGIVRAEGKWITIVSSSQACSRIDYFINGEPRSNVIMDGQGRVEWFGPPNIESIDVEGCVVCADNLVGSGSGGIIRSETDSIESNVNISGTSAPSDKELTGTVLFSRQFGKSGSKVITQILLDGRSLGKLANAGASFEVELPTGRHRLTCEAHYKGKLNWQGATTVEVTDGSFSRIVLENEWGGGACNFVPE